MKVTIGSTQWDFQIQTAILGGGFWVRVKRDGTEITRVPFFNRDHAEDWQLMAMVHLRQRGSLPQ